MLNNDSSTTFVSHWRNYSTKLSTYFTANQILNSWYLNSANLLEQIPFLYISTPSWYVFNAKLRTAPRHSALAVASTWATRSRALLPAQHVPGRWDDRWHTPALGTWPAGTQELLLMGHGINSWTPFPCMGFILTHYKDCILKVGWPFHRNLRVHPPVGNAAFPSRNSRP